MLLLALDTATACVTAAVADGGGVLAERSAPQARRHAELLAPSVEAVLREAGATPSDLTAVAVGVGPGPFTGLRVGLVTARVLAAARGLAVHGACTLDVVAQGAVERGRAGRFVVATDARRREVHWATYEVREGVAVRLEGPHVGAPGDVPRDGLDVVGRGALVHPEALGPAAEPLDPSAAGLARLVLARLAGAPGDLLPPDPLYLRRPDAAEPAARKRVLT